MNYMLDTNICVYIMKNHPPHVQERLRKVPIGSVSISSIVLAELWYGVKKSAQVAKNTQALKDFLNFLMIEAWPSEAAYYYGDIRTELQKAGNIIGPNDLFIAAHAQYMNAVLVTNNTNEFKRIGNLKLENWAAS